MRAGRRLPGPAAVLALLPALALLPVLAGAPTATAATSGPSVADPRLGRPAPEFQLPGPEGPQSEVRLAALHGKLVLLAFWASWCPACQQAFPWLDGLQRRYGAMGLQVVGVGVDSRDADAREFLLQHPAHFSLGFDPAAKLARSFEIRAMPAFLLIAPDGRVVAVHEGWEGASGPAPLEQALRAALPAHGAGPPAAPGPGSPGPGPSGSRSPG